MLSKKGTEGMLESTNDYMSILTLAAVLIAFLAMVLHLVSVRATARHLREEADYYERGGGSGRAVRLRDKDHDSAG
jgi:NADH:ubiquinone oxidoreductase subunit 3 (subunit A)